MVRFRQHRPSGQRAPPPCCAPAHFNSLQVDPILNTITKVSENNAKLEDELNWYLQLPDEIKVLAPRIVSHEVYDDQLRIVQEYYGYPTLTELYVYGDLHADTWASILRHVFRIHADLSPVSGRTTSARRREHLSG